MSDHLAFESVADGTMRHVDRGSLFSMQSPDALSPVHGNELRLIRLKGRLQEVSLLITGDK